MEQPAHNSFGENQFRASRRKVRAQNLTRSPERSSNFHLSRDEETDESESADGILCVWRGELNGTALSFFLPMKQGENKELLLQSTLVHVAISINIYERP
jgi:hypothetical protein